VETKCEFPQGLKPNSPRTCNGTAEAVPFQSLPSLATETDEESELDAGLKRLTRRCAAGV
jgi:hypothetical protein